MRLQGHEIPPADEANGLPLHGLNAVRLGLVLVIGMGYASTMGAGPGAPEWAHHLGYDPSWFGVQALFFLSGYLGWRSLSLGRRGGTYLRSRLRRTLPVLVLYTLTVTTVAYPLLCQPGRLDADGIAQLALYTLKTISLVSPGGLMPGALDSQPYACLLQGTVWTLRWGAALHLATVLGHLIGVRRGRGLLLATTAALLAYAVCAMLWVEGGMDAVAPVAPGLRLAYPWALGACAYAYRERLPRRASTWVLAAMLCFGLAGLHEDAGWSPLIEVLGTGAWISLTLAALLAAPAAVSRTPPLALPVYLGVWPITQVLLYTLPGLSTSALVVMSLSLTVAAAYSVLAALSGVFSPPAASHAKSPRTA